MTSSSVHPIGMRVAEIHAETDGVRVLTLRPRCHVALPPVEAGAHIDLLLPLGQSRSYSLIGPPGATDAYRIAVARDPVSRGGSAFIHDRLSPGDALDILPPRNHFALDETAAVSVLIAGGIGITPLWCMAQRLNQIGGRWQLHYACRSRSMAAFEQALVNAAAAGPGSVDFWWDDEHDGTPLDIRSIVDRALPGAQFYCCGPAPMMAAFQAVTAGLSPERVHLEFFKRAAVETTRPLGGFTVELARSGRSVQVPLGSTILDALMMQGIDAPYSCYEGLCGTCETRVLAGIPDHRDQLLTEKAKASNESVIICCSGSRTPKLVLDL